MRVLKQLRAYSVANPAWSKVQLVYPGDFLNPRNRQNPDNLTLMLSHSDGTRRYESFCNPGADFVGWVS